MSIPSSSKGEKDSLLEQFVKENALQYSKEMKKIFAKIKKMADITGCRKSFLKKEKGCGQTVLLH